jgi:hypothetical protein
MGDEGASSGLAGTSRAYPRVLLSFASTHWARGTRDDCKCLSNWSSIALLVGLGKDDESWQLLIDGFVLARLLLSSSSSKARITDTTALWRCLDGDPLSPPPIICVSKKSTSC